MGVLMEPRFVPAACQSGHVTRELQRQYETFVRRAAILWSDLYQDRPQNFGLFFGEIKSFPLDNIYKHLVERRESEDNLPDIWSEVRKDPKLFKLVVKVLYKYEFGFMSTSDAVRLLVGDSCVSLH
jgi:hypothetical protein